MLQRKESISTSSSSTPTLEIILQSIRALLPPHTAAYHACNHERIESHAAQLAALDVELETIRMQAFEACARLMALQQPALGEGGAL